MFDLEKAVSDWRARLRNTSGVGEAELAELEAHLRDSIDALAEIPLNVEESFLLASHRLGDAESLAVEFGKNRLQSSHSGFLPLAHIEHDGSIDEQVYAGFSRRLMAFGFDVCITLLVLIFLLHPASLLPPVWAAFTLTLLNILFSACVVSLVYCQGGTLGKILAGIRICRPDGSALSLSQAVRRCAPWLVFTLFELIVYVQSLHIDLIPAASQISTWAVPAILLLAAAWLLASILMLIRNEHRRTPQDYFADTIVVDEKYARVSAITQAADPSAGSVFA